MAFFQKRKRKNDDLRRFPARIMVLIAVGAVIIVVMLFQSSTRNLGGSSLQIVDPTLDDSYQLTATYIIQQATALAQGTPQSIAAPLSSNNLDPIEMTATYLIKLATEQASTPSS